MIRIGIEIDPPSQEKITLELNKFAGFRKWIVISFKYGLPLLAALAVIILLNIGDLSAYDLPIVITLAGVAMVYALLWTILNEIDDQLYLFSNAHDAVDTVRLCKKYDACENYRQKVLALRRPLIAAEARLFKRYEKAMKKEFIDQKNAEAMEMLSQQESLTRHHRPPHHGQPPQ
jgi:hypothetical protein